MSRLRGSLRLRLTLWSVALACLVGALLTTASWLLLVRGASRAADESLRAQLGAVARFLEALEPDQSEEQRQDEFHELALGVVLVEVRDAGGAPLCRSPGVDWNELSSGLPPAGERVPTSRTLDGQVLRVARERLATRAGVYDVVVALPTSQTAAVLRQFRDLLLWLLPALLLGASAGSYWLTGRALAPVERITRQVRAIDARRLSQRVEVPAADDELRNLATTFNDMLGRLDAAFAESVRFTADAAHELRTPVALLRTSAEIALRRERSPAEYREALAGILREAERMSALVHELLALARTDAGVEPPPATLCDLGELAGRAARELWDARPAGPALTIEPVASAVEVRGDPAALRRLAHAVLDNAARYTPQGGVRVSVSRDGAEAVLQVCDTGIGVAPEELPLLFRRFHRGARARAIDPGGSGLGLAIVRAIVERHRGSVRIDSPEGLGCRVTVRLPAA